MAEVDIGALFTLLGSVATDVREMKADIREMKADIREVRETKADRSEVKAEFASLREALTHYHSAVLGHGVLISELDERVRRIEKHLGLPPAAE